jgi:FKBP-type peptidyl-prolyl cis-trans isomerase FkpA
MKTIFLFLLSLSLFSACQKTPNEQDSIDDTIITSYLNTNQIEATKTSSGLYYKITKEGEGKYVSSSATVLIKYKGYLKDSTVFDENTTGISLDLKNAIQGWREGLTYFKVGGKGTLFIPSKLGYGSRSIGSIPSNSVLFFDIEVLVIQ